MKRICDHCSKVFYSNRTRQRLCGYKCRALEYHYNNYDKRIAYMKARRDAAIQEAKDAQAKAAPTASEAKAAASGVSLSCEIASIGKFSAPTQDCGVGNGAL